MEISLHVASGYRVNHRALISQLGILDNPY